MNIVDLTRDCGIHPKRVSATNGGEYQSPCPMCGGTDRFHVWPAQGEHGKWWCRGCGKGGDAIQFLRDVKGMRFREACEYLGKVLPVKAEAGPPQIQPTHEPRTCPHPPQAWQTKAAAFTNWAHDNLLKNKGVINWLLAERGLTPETIRRFKLGWNPEDIYRHRQAWGLPEEKRDDGKPKKIWIPAGLVIPYINPLFVKGEAEGGILRIRIRRPQGEPRYILVPNSNTAPMVVPKEANSQSHLQTYIIVESELDALLISQEAGGIGAIAIGNSSARPDTTTHALLKDANKILFAMDYDTAGAEAWRWWKQRYPQASRFPVPMGKDPGDYFKIGGNVREWIKAVEI